MSKTADQIADQLQSLLPPGKALAGGINSTLRKLLLALSDELVRVYDRSGDLVEEFYSSHVNELLQEWETENGLPDPCVQAPQTTQDRINALIAKITSIPAPSIGYFIDYAQNIGVTITIEEQRPFQIGINGMGDPIGGQKWWSVWHVHAPLSATTVQREQIECHFRKIKHAHTVVSFIYE